MTSCLSMLKDGTYSAWFKTPLGEGTGIAHLADGKIWGRDSIVTYSGSCDVDGDTFTAIVRFKRHSEGHATVFGAEDLTLKLEGTCVDKVGKYTATSDELPGVQLEGTLIRTDEVKHVPPPSGPLPPFNLDKLPKLPKRSR